MAAKIRRVDFSFDEWIGGTVGMSLEEEGLYIRIVARYYSRGEAPPADHYKLAKMCNVRPQTVLRLMPKLMSKFKKVGDKLRQNRCETEIKLALNRLVSSRINGAKHRKNKHLKEPGGSEPSTINHQSSFPEGKELLMGGAIAPTPASSPPLGDAVGLRKRGARLVGNSLIVEQQITAVGPDKVARALDAVERKKRKNPVAYFLACCRGPAAVAAPILLTREEVERHAAERREAARLECLREAGLCAND